MSRQADLGAQRAAGSASLDGGNWYLIRSDPIEKLRCLKEEDKIVQDRRAIVLVDFEPAG